MQSGPSGKITEVVMARVHEALPDLTTEQYNRIWESVYFGLENADGVAIVPDNDWSVAARFSALPMKKKRAIIAMMAELAA